MTAALIIVAVIMVGGLAVGWYRFRQLSRENLSQSHQLERLQRELAAVNNAAIGVGQRLMSLEKRVNQSLENAAQIEHRDDFRSAEELVASGAVISDLVERCGLSEAEAELMTKLRSRSGSVQV